MRWFARFLLKQVAAGSWVSRIRRSVGRRGEDLPSGSRVDLGAISRFAEYCENQVGLAGRLTLSMVGSKFTHLISESIVVN